jgi:hypothetical protein
MLRAMLEALKRLFRPRRPRELPGETRGVEVLDFVGVAPIVVSWAQRHPAGLDGLWHACPRADWLLEIAHRAGLPLERLVGPVRRLALALDHDWTTAESLLDDLTAALDEAVDGDRRLVELQKSVNAAFAVGPRTPIPDLAYQKLAEAEERHRSLHAGFADAVREAIEYRDIRAALYQQPAGPYR